MAQMTKYPINIVETTYTSRPASLSIAIFLTQLTNFYIIYVFLKTAVGTALWRYTGRNKFSCGYSDLRMPIPVYLDAHRNVLGCPSRFMRMPIRFYLNTDACLSVVCKNIFSVVI